MKRKTTKLLLLPINIVCLVLILISFFDKNEAFNEEQLMGTIQNNLIYAVFPASDQSRYKFDKRKGFRDDRAHEKGLDKDWRYNQLINISKIDQTTGNARGSTQANDVLQFEEFEYLMYTEPNSDMTTVFTNAVINLRDNVARFAENNFINKNYCNVEQVKRELNNDETVDDLELETLSLERSPIKSPLHSKKISKKGRKSTNWCGCFSTPSTYEVGESSQQRTASPKKKRENPCTKLIKLVVKCKIFIKDLHSPGNEGTLIDIFSFMEKDVELKHLNLIYELSEIQSKKLDIAINARIYQEHLENKRIKGNKHAIVQGAGPVGLYAAYKLFMDGINITLVNDRTEEYMRNRVVDFDRIWMSELRFFLGTEFDNFFKGEGSLGKLFDEGIGFFNIKNLENLLKERLKVLSKYIDRREQNIIDRPKSFLKSIYEVAVLDIETYNRMPLAILGTPEKQFNPNAQNELEGMVEIYINYGWNPEDARSEILRQKIENIKNIYGGLIPYTRYRGDVVEYITAEHLAKLQIEGKAFELKNLEEEFNYLENVEYTSDNIGRAVAKIPFDFFFCAGGANDQIRNKYLEKPQQLTESKNYGVVIFDKKHWDRDRYVFDDGTAFFRDPITDMKEYLEEQKLDEFIHSSLPSEMLKERYAKLTDFILSRKKKDREGNLIGDQVVVRLFESNPTLHIASITPVGLEQFINDFKDERKGIADLLKTNESKMYNEIKKYEDDGYQVDWNSLTLLKDENEKELKKYDDFHEELQKRWARALFNYTFNTRHEKKIGTVEIREREENREKQREASGSRKGKEKMGETSSDKRKGKMPEPKQILYFDRYSLNTTTFDVAIYGIENPVKQLDNGSIIAAIGDANTSAHFMTASGISTGRFGVESVSAAIKNSDNFNLEGNLRNGLRKVRRRVLEKASEYVKVREGIQVDLEENIEEVDSEIEEED